jgi:alkylation response protein AidB-like acyl-CoA dehydrogenase
MEQFISSRNIRFILHEMLNVADLQRFEYYQDYDKSAFDMAIDAAKQIAETAIFPYNREFDKFKVKVENNVTHVHPQLKNLIKAVADGGWICSTAPYEVGGGQMPHVLTSAGIANFYAASCNAAYPFLTSGAANLIISFGNQALKDSYIPDMISGKWQGTMALTEPQAGSSLSDVITSATPTDKDGVYKIKGQKIYISGGDHDTVDNIIHLTLARIKGAPAGTKGISLFVVPKFRLDGTPNDVTTAGIYGKMGQKNYTAAHLMYGEGDDCEGYLVGEAHHGLAYMFQMMNEARIGTGLLAFGNTTAAYYASLKYANERPQGRHPSNKDLTLPQVLIIEHADVRRMLLMQKAVAEGSIALLLQASLYNDIAHAAQGEEKDNALLILELLTPICKSYPSEMGIVAIKNAMQVLGGAGYCDDFPIEQFYREIPINSIYEGTTTIHGMDLLGRKVMMKNGAAMKLLAKEIMDSIEKATQHTTLLPYAQKLGKSAQKLNEVTQHLIQLAMKEDAQVFLADATLYLEYFGNVVMGWIWLKQGIVANAGLENAANEEEANFYKSKIQTLKYFFEYELPKTKGLHERLMSSERVTLETDATLLV